MSRFNRWFTSLLAVTLLLGACQPIRPPPALWPQAAAPQNLAFVGHLGGPALALALEGCYAYVSFPAELAVFDLVDPAHPVRRGYLPIAAADLVVAGNYAYAASRYGLWIVAITDPMQPQPLGYLPLDGATALTSQGPYLYLADSNGYLSVVDAHNPRAPIRLGQLDLLAPITDLTVADQYLYLVTLEGLAVVDVAMAQSPALVGFLALPGTPQTLVLSDHYAIIADGQAGLRVIDIANPGLLRAVGSLDLRAEAGDVTVQDGYAFVAAGEAGVYVVDVRQPPALEIVGAVDTPGSANAVVVDKDLVYVADQHGGL